MKLKVGQTVWYWDENANQIKSRTILKAFLGYGPSVMLDDQCVWNSDDLFRSLKDAQDFMKLSFKKQINTHKLNIQAAKKRIKELELDIRSLK